MIPDTNLGLFMQIPNVYVSIHMQTCIHIDTHTIHNHEKKRITSSLLSQGDKKLGDDFMCKVSAV